MQTRPSAQGVDRPKYLRLFTRYIFICIPCMIGPHKWFALPGQVLTPRTPQELDIFDRRGEQAGAHHWTGLREKEAEINKGYWRRSPWEGHACDLCRRNTPIDGEDFLTNAAAADGCTSTRYFKARVLSSFSPSHCELRVGALFRVGLTTRAGQMALFARELLVQALRTGTVGPARGV